MSNSINTQKGGQKYEGRNWQRFTILSIIQVFEHFGSQKSALKLLDNSHKSTETETERPLCIMAFASKRSLSSPSGYLILSYLLLSFINQAVFYFHIKARQRANTME